MKLQLLDGDPTVYLRKPPPEVSHPWDIMDYIIYGGLALLALWVLSVLIRPKVAMKNWHHYFVGLEIASRDLYEQIMAEIKERKLPDLMFNYRRYFEAGIFTSRREYLSIGYMKFNLDVCCIAYGEGYYMSWWLGEDDPGLFSRIPILNDLVGLNPKYKSYYQIDTATLFQSAVHDAILTVIDRISKEKGIRPLTELERQPKYGRT